MSACVRTLFVALAVFAATGCLQKTQPTGTVSGKVTHKGKPVAAGCLVTFVSERGVVALGTVDAGGKYRLMMAGKPDIPALEYNISVTHPGSVGPEMTDEDERKFMLEMCLVVAMVLQRFDVEILPDQAIRPKAALTLRPSARVQVALKRGSPNQSQQWTGALHVS